MQWVGCVIEVVHGKAADRLPHAWQLPMLPKNPCNLKWLAGTNTARLLTLARSKT